MAEHDAALEHVGVVAVIVRRRVGRGQAKQDAQLGNEKLVVGALATAGGLPAGDKGVEGGGFDHGGSQYSEAG